jgi:hypothetical protein
VPQSVSASVSKSLLWSGSVSLNVELSSVVGDSGVSKILIIDLFANNSFCDRGTTIGGVQVVKNVKKFGAFQIASYSVGPRRARSISIYYGKVCPFCWSSCYCVL